MESFNTEFLDQYLQIVQSESSHIIECVSGKKKWLFYFENGQLVQTKSNLKPEQTESLRENHPKASMDEIALIQAKMRVEKAFSAEEIHLKSSSKSPEGSIPTLDAFVGGFSVFLQDNPASLAEIQKKMEQLRPKLLSPMSIQRSDIQRFMATLKGNLRAPVTISNSGLSEADGWATLWTLQALNLFEVDESAQESLADLLDFNLDDVLAEEVAKEDEYIEEPALEEVVSETAAHTEDLSSMDSSVNSVDSIQDTEATGFSSFEQIEEPASMTDVTTVPTTSRVNTLDELEAHIQMATNHFEVLGLPYTASADEFRKAYFDLSKKLHPDRFHTEGEEVIARATALFDRVRAAHEVVGNDAERNKYIDNVIHGKATDEDAAMQQLQAVWKAEEAFKKGERLFQQGQLGRAHDFFQEAHDNDPNSLEFKAYLGYTTFTQNKGSNQTKAQEGLEMILEVTRLNEDQEVKLDSAWVLLAKAYRESGDKDKAFKAITRALKIKPSNSDAQRELKRIRGQEPGAKKPAKGAQPEEKKGGFWSKLFGGGK